MSTAERVLAVARHPSFTSDAAVRVVQGLSWRDLRDVWDASSRSLAGPLLPGPRCGIVILRAEILREMALRDPAAFDVWYAGLRMSGPRRQRRRR